VPLYEYNECEQQGDELVPTGRRFAIEAPMTEAPPLRIEEGGKVLVRVFGKVGGIVKKGGSTSHQGAELPISHTLPRVSESEVVGRTKIGKHEVLELRNGQYADVQGRRIVDGNKAASAHAGTTGYTRET
jgi:predicted nucleic acid-binding Zn ribbon protein